MRMSCKLSSSQTRRKALLVLGGVEKLGRVEEKEKDRKAHSNIYFPKTQLRKISQTQVSVSSCLWNFETKLPPMYLDTMQSNKNFMFRQKEDLNLRPHSL